MKNSSNSNGGPATQHGKAIASRNSTRHGLLSENPVVSAVETREGWENHRTGVLESISPAGHLESTLGERVALLSWRLARVTRYETEKLSLAQEKIEEGIHERGRFRRAVFGGSIADPTHPEDIRGEAEWAKQRHHSLKRFVRLEPEKTMKGSAPSDVIHSVLVKAQRITAREIDQDELMLPGIGEDEDLVELDPMKVGDMRGCVEYIAEAAGLGAEELLERATEEARLETIKAAHKLEETEREIDRLSRENLLPGKQELEKIARYEAHLSKQLYAALHELEALQKRRLTGEETPLARLEVNGYHDGA